MSLVQVQEGNTIMVPLEIRLADLEQVDAALQKLRKMRDEGGTYDRELASQLLDSENRQQGAPGFAGMAGNELGMNLGMEGAQTLVGLARNPAGFLVNIIRMHPYIAAALMAAGLGVAVFELLTRKGMPLDIHFKRILALEINKGRRREERQQIRTGRRQVIFTSNSGSTTPELAFNSYEAVRNGEIFAMDIFRVRSGYQF